MRLPFTMLVGLIMLALPVGIIATALSGEVHRARSQTDRGNQRRRR
jgi:hypothetical protein